MRLCKYLSYYLRHRPGELGLKLAPRGWVPVEALLAASARKGFAIAREDFEEVVTRNDKRRFASDESGTFICVRQFHRNGVWLVARPAAIPRTALRDDQVEEAGALRGRLEDETAAGLLAGPPSVPLEGRYCW